MASRELDHFDTDAKGDLYAPGDQPRVTRTGYPPVGLVATENGHDGIEGGTQRRSLRSNNGDDCEEPIAGESSVPGVEDSADDPLPEGGYGWVIVGCLIAMNASTWGESLNVGPDRALPRPELTKRDEHDLWCLLGILYPAQLLRRGLDVPVCLGRRIERRGRACFGPAG